MARKKGFAGDVSTWVEIQMALSVPSSERVK
jgi:hypothetical protein